MRRFFLRLTAVLALAPTAGAFHVADPPAPPAALADFFKPGTVFQDRNADGVVDFVSAQISLADKPTVGELAAAADVASRLGFETTAMNIPVARGLGLASDVGATVFIGARALSRGALSADNLGSPASNLVMGWWPRSQPGGNRRSRSRAATTTGSRQPR